MHTPLVLSYTEMPYGTYPDWFDTTYWNEQIKPHFSVRQDLPRATRDSVLMVRYLFNHPEALLLLALLLLLGARPELAGARQEVGTQRSGWFRCCWASPSGASTPSSTRKSAM